MHVSQDESPGGAEGLDGRPANLFWRILQSVCDDLVITSFALTLAWALGVLPLPAERLDVSGGPRAVAEAVSRAVTPARAGATLLIYAAGKFVYYVAFVAWGGRTPACHLLRLRIVRADGAPASVGNAVRRAVAGGVIGHTPVVGQLLRIGDYLMALFNRRKQAVRDMVAGTMLVHSIPPRRRGRRPAG
ncbi:MAG TPA: RDD family protein [Pyrinomonadaceae bacterium]|nr:RDD family protein [Pyrinomonadaceae bacterium]